MSILADYRDYRKCMGLNRQSGLLKEFATLAVVVGPPVGAIAATIGLIADAVREPTNDKITAAYVLGGIALCVPAVSYMIVWLSAGVYRDREAIYGSDGEDAPHP